MIILAQLIHLIKQKNPECNCIRDSIKLVILVLVFKCTPDTTYDERISNMIKYINKHFSEIHSIDQIAEQMHVSKHHLCRVFKEAMGITMIDYLNNIRVKNACNFLESSDKDILEISQLCGFNSSAYFGNVFKKITGCSPLRYRKECGK